MLTSFANTAGGLVLIGTWATLWQRVPIIVLLIGGSLLIQGGYAILCLHGDFDFWRDLATGRPLFSRGAYGLSSPWSTGSRPRRMNRNS